jgi:Family of unknown function (DUF6364)
LTVRLPKDDLEFVKRYARTHRVTVTELIDRYLRQLRGQAVSPIHPEVVDFANSPVPALTPEELLATFASAT